MAEAKQAMYRAKYPSIYHATSKALWSGAVGAGKPYYPPTFEVDGGLTHATAEASKLIPVLNHFYSSELGDWVCLVVSLAELEKAGVDVVFEKATAVGTTEAVASDDLFPHIKGGIPASAVTDLLPIHRKEDGTFLSVAEK